MLRLKWKFLEIPSGTSQLGTCMKGLLYIVHAGLMGDRAIDHKVLFPEIAFLKQFPYMPL